MSRPRHRAPTGAPAAMQHWARNPRPLSAEPLLRAALAGAAHWCLEGPVHRASRALQLVTHAP